MRLLVMACSASKRSEPGTMAADQRYDGPAYRLLRAHRPTNTRILILSAQHGLIHHRTPIEAYDRKMTRARAAEIAADPPSRNLLLVSVPYSSDIFVFGGAHYRHCIELMSAGIEQHAPIVYSTGSIGIQLQQLKQWLLTRLSVSEELTVDRLHSIRQRIDDERLGLRVKGAKVKSGWAKHFGLSPRATHEVVIARIDDEIRKRRPSDEPALMSVWKT